MALWFRLRQTDKAKVERKLRKAQQMAKEVSGDAKLEHDNRVVELNAVLNYVKGYPKDKPYVAVVGQDWPQIPVAAPPKAGFVPKERKKERVKDVPQEQPEERCLAEAANRTDPVAIVNRIEGPDESTQKWEIADGVSSSAESVFDEHSGSEVGDNQSSDADDSQDSVGYMSDEEGSTEFAVEIQGSKSAPEEEEADDFFVAAGPRLPALDPHAKSGVAKNWAGGNFRKKGGPETSPGPNSRERRRQRRGQEREERTFTEPAAKYNKVFDSD